MLDAPENGKHKDIVETMAEYAQQHFDQEVTVKELAEKVLFMNQDYLSHLFVEKKRNQLFLLSQTDQDAECGEAFGKQKAVHYGSGINVRLQRYLPVYKSI